jgi:hypothetical protein
VCIHTYTYTYIPTSSGEFVLARLLVALGAIKKKVNVIGLLGHGLCQIRDGRRVVLEASLSEGAKIPRFSIRGPEFYGHVQVLYRVLVLFEPQV